MMLYLAGWVPLPALPSVKKPLTKCKQGAILVSVKSHKGGVAMHEARLKVLQELGARVGVSVQPAGKRGEVIITLPHPIHKDAEGFTLRLSREKAFALLFWLEIKLEQNQKGG